MSVSITDLINDLAAETTVLTECLDTLDEAAWALQTPAAGWTIIDQVVHLAFFDEAVTTAVSDPDRFRAERDEAMHQLGSFVEAIAAANRGLTGVQAARRFKAARAAMVKAFGVADLHARVPWYGPDMSVASALTARIMETWAHGQDIYDALGREHAVTPALRQVAHIGVRALPNSFVSRRREVPTTPVFVRLDAPDGSEWTWGDADAANRVSGPAVDFCLIVTQRRHRADTTIVIEGDVAAEWMSIAQAFAGPVGTGRAAGQFAS